MDFRRIDFEAEAHRVAIGGERGVVRVSRIGLERRAAADREADGDDERRKDAVELFEWGKEHFETSRSP